MNSARTAVKRLLSRSFDSPSRTVTAVAVALAVAILGSFAYSAYHEYFAALARAERDTRNATSVLAEHTARTFDAVEESLNAVARIHNDVAARVYNDKRTVHGLLKAAHGASPVIAALGWTDAAGSRVASSLHVDPPSLSVANQEHFRSHRDNPDAGLHISAPIRSRLTNEWIINVSIRLQDGQGRFAGVASALVDPNYFASVYRSVDLGPERNVILLRDDGIIMARDPELETWLGKSLAHGEVFRDHVSQFLSGSVHVRSLLDGVDRILSFAKVSGAPLRIMVGMSRASALAPFYDNVRGEAYRVGVLLLVLVIGSRALIVQLRRREENERARRLLASVVESSDDAIFTRTLDGVITSWNEGATLIFGYSAEEIIGRHISLIVPPGREDEPGVLSGSISMGSRVSNFETRRRRKDGRLIDVALTASPLYDAAGAIVGVSLIARDTTTLKQADEDLRVSEERYRALYKHTPVMMHSIDQEGRLISVSDYWLESLGYTREEVIGRPSSEFLTAESQVYARDIVMPAFFRTGSCKDVQYQFVRRNGSIVDVLLSATAERDASGRVVRSLAVLIDVTEQKRAEAELRESEERFRSMTANVPGIVYRRVLHRDGRITFPYFSRGVLDIFGVPREEAMADPSVIIDAIHPDDLDGFLRSVDTSARELSIWQGDFRITARDGSTKWLSGRSHPRRMPNGDVVWDGVVMDITERKRFEEALRDAEARALQAHARLVDAIDSLADGFLLWDTEDRLVLRNEAASVSDPENGRLLTPGVRFEDVMAERVRLGRITAAKGREEEYVRERIAQHRNPTGETIEQQFDDGRWISIRERRTRDGAIVSVRTDITELKRREAELMVARAEAEQAKARLVDAIESLEDGFLLWDQNGRLVLSNQAAMRMGETSGVQLKPGDRFADLISRQARSGRIPEAVGREDHYIAERLEQHRNPSGVPVEVKFNNDRWISVRRNRTRDGGVVVVRTDVTDVKKREAELIAARAEADAANQAKSEFLSRMSHELRTPLNAIIGFAQMLELDRQRLLSIEQREYCNFIINGGKHLLSLVNEVLDLARIEAGSLKLSLERVVVAASLADVSHTMMPMAGKAEIDLVVAQTPDIPDVRADELRLRQILINLVSNAIKYNRAGGSVRLSAAHTDRGRVRFEVVDTGIGIAREMQTDLFLPFQRLGAEYTTVEGTGIGLAICKRLVEAMGGTIGFMSERGQGSTFWIELPVESARRAVEEPSTDMALAAAAPRATAGGYTLLYVEDNPANLRLMEHLMAGLPNVSMLAAPTPQLGLELAVAHRPDVIVLDLNLPGMSGYEVLARLKGLPETCDTPVLALTAAALPKDIERGLQAGFFRYLTKPLDIKAFLVTIDEVLATLRTDPAARAANPG